MRSRKIYEGVFLLLLSVFAVGCSAHKPENAELSTQETTSLESVLPSDEIFYEHEISQEIDETTWLAESNERAEQELLSGSAGNMPVPATMENTLFIGDSRTVGLAEHGHMEGASFFSSVGMTVYSAEKTEVAIPGTGKVTLGQLLNHQQYDRIYVMLGINELGYPFEKTVNRYKDLIQMIHEVQPQALVFVEANLHVTKARSDRDRIINNEKLDQFNDEISQLANGNTIFYLDANRIFDDSNGALSEEKSGDDTHLLEKYYQEWGSWIAYTTGEILTQLQGV